MGDSKSLDLAKRKRVRLRLPQGPGRLLSKKAAMSLIGQLAEQLGVRLQLDGADWVSELPDGMATKVRQSVQEADYPWKGRTISGDLWVLGGYVNDLEISSAEATLSNGIACLVLNFTLDVEDGFVYGGTLSSAAIDFFASKPPDDGSTGEFYIPLVTYDGTDVILQSARKHAIVGVCDNGAGTGTAVLNVIQI